MIIPDWNFSSSHPYSWWSAGDRHVIIYSGTETWTWSDWDKPELQIDPLGHCDPVYTIRFTGRRDQTCYRIQWQKTVGTVEEIDPFLWGREEDWEKGNPVGPDPWLPRGSPILRPRDLAPIRAAAKCNRIVVRDGSTRGAEDAMWLHHDYLNSEDARDKSERGVTFPQEPEWAWRENRPAAESTYTSSPDNAGRNETLSNHNGPWTGARQRCTPKVLW